YLGATTHADAGAQVAQQAGKYFGLELEGLSPEDQEFEAAKAFVRFAGEAVKRATVAPATAASENVAQAAALRAAHRFAPGLLRNNPTSPATFPRAPFAPNRAGRWIRHGRNIIIVNC